MLQDAIIDYCYKNPIIRKIWSLFPPRCEHPECEKLNMRWTETKLEVLEGPNKGAWAWCCHTCWNKVRNAAFNHGFQVVHNEDGSTEYHPPSDT